MSNQEVLVSTSHRFSDDAVLAIMLVVIGCLPAGDALFSGRSFGVEATLGLILISLGVLVFVQAIFASKK